MAEGQKILTHPFGVFSLAVRHRFFCTQTKEMGSRKIVPQRAKPFGSCDFSHERKGTRPEGETCRSASAEDARSLLPGSRRIRENKVQRTKSFEYVTLRLLATSGFPRRRKLHIARFRLCAKTRSLRCSSSPSEARLHWGPFWLVSGPLARPCARPRCGPSGLLATAQRFE